MYIVADSTIQSIEYKHRYFIYPLIIQMKLISIAILVLWACHGVLSFTPGVSQQLCFPMREPGIMQLKTDLNSTFMLYRAVDAINSSTVPQIRGYDMRSRKGPDNPVLVCNETLASDGYCTNEEIGTFILDGDFAFFNEQVSDSSEWIYIPIESKGVYCLYCSTRETHLGSNEGVTTQEAWYDFGHNPKLQLWIDAAPYEQYVVWKINLALAVLTPIIWKIFLSGFIRDHGVKDILVFLWGIWAFCKAVVIGLGCLGDVLGLLEVGSFKRYHFIGYFSGIGDYFLLMYYMFLWGIAAGEFLRWVSHQAVLSDSEMPYKIPVVTDQHDLLLFAIMTAYWFTLYLVKCVIKIVEATDDLFADSTTHGKLGYGIWGLYYIMIFIAYIVPLLNALAHSFRVRNIEISRKIRRSVYTSVSVHVGIYVFSWISRLGLQLYVNGSVYWTWYLVTNPVMEEVGLRVGVVFVLLKNLDKFCCISTLLGLSLVWSWSPEKADGERVDLVYIHLP